MRGPAAYGESQWCGAKTGSPEAEEEVMNPYLLQLAAEDRAESMRSAAAIARLARQARQASRVSPSEIGHLLRAIPRQRVPEESVTRRAA